MTTTILKDKITSLSSEIAGVKKIFAISRRCKKERVDELVENISLTQRSVRDRLSQVRAKPTGFWANLKNIFFTDNKAEKELADLKSYHQNLNAAFIFLQNIQSPGKFQKADLLEDLYATLLDLEVAGKRLTDTYE